MQKSRVHGIRTAQTGVKKVGDIEKPAPTEISVSIKQDSSRKIKEKSRERTSEEKAKKRKKKRPSIRKRIITTTTAGVPVTVEATTTVAPSTSTESEVTTAHTAETVSLIDYQVKLYVYFILNKPFQPPNPAISPLDIRPIVPSPVVPMPVVQSLPIQPVIQAVQPLPHLQIQPIQAQPVQVQPTAPTGSVEEYLKAYYDEWYKEWYRSASSHKKNYFLSELTIRTLLKTILPDSSELYQQDWRLLLHLSFRNQLWFVVLDIAISFFRKFLQFRLKQLLNPCRW